MDDQPQLRIKSLDPWPCEVIGWAERMCEKLDALGPSDVNEMTSGFFEHVFFELMTTKPHTDPNGFLSEKHESWRIMIFGSTQFLDKTHGSVGDTLFGFHNVHGLKLVH